MPLLHQNHIYNYPNEAVLPKFCTCAMSKPGKRGTIQRMFWAWSVGNYCGALRLAGSRSCLADLRIFASNRIFAGNSFSPQLYNF
jgi:hypothetical protein